MERRRLKSIASTPTSATTFVQADTNTFRDLVQKLTGLPTQHKRTSHLVGRTAPRRSTFKLQERRHDVRNLDIKLHGLHSLTPTHDHQLVDSPVQSPMTSLLLSSSATGDESPLSSWSFEEEKAIAEKGFYLHPWPLSTPRGSEPPELLILFPLSSPSQMTRG